MPTDLIALREAQASDADFLLSLRKATMTSYLELAGMPTDEQTHAQRINAHFSDAKIILCNGVDAGLFKAFITDGYWYISQIQVMPDFQSRGIGAFLINETIARAKQAQLGVKLNVLKTNPARALYERLGFRIETTIDPEYQMRYHADAMQL